MTKTPTIRITPQAVTLFRQMQALEAKCTCTSAHRECNACGEWWELHDRLHGELRLKPWQFPCIEQPTSSYPGFHDKVWFGQAQRLYTELQKAAM